MKQLLAVLALLLTVSLCSCKQSGVVVTAEDGHKLNAASEIAAEIKKKHAIECAPYMKAEDGVALIEFNDTDPASDYESLVREISKLGSVQSFDGELQLLFRSAASDSGAVENLGRFDAKSGQLLQP